MVKKQFSMVKKQFCTRIVCLDFWPVKNMFMGRKMGNGHLLFLVIQDLEGEKSNS